MMEEVDHFDICIHKLFLTENAYEQNLIAFRPYQTYILHYKLKLSIPL